MDIANAGLVHRLDARHSSSRDLDNIGPIQSYIDLSILLLGVLLIYPIDALAIAGDVIHNLRSAFDHLAYQLVCVGTGDEFPKNTGFPIADSAKAYEEEKERRKVERMPPKAVEAIDFLKPYRSGNPPLWRIHNP
jgi:hypothetical protein